MAAKVTITFTSTSPMAMMRNWLDELGLVDPAKMLELGIEQLELEVRPARGDE